MSETPTPTPAAATIAIAGDTMGHDFLAALLAELRQMPDHWGRLSQDQQQKIIDRLREKVTSGVQQCVQILLRSEFAAVQAELTGITLKKGIGVSLTVPKDALFRHALFDAKGSDVLLVLTNGGNWVQRMDEIKAKDNQIDLFESDKFDPDGGIGPYHRGDGPRVPAGMTWAALKESLQGPLPAAGEPPAGAEGQPAPTPEGEEPPADPAAPAADDPDSPGEAIPEIESSSLDADGEHTVSLRLLQDLLASQGCGISLGELKARSPEDIKAAETWIQKYASNPKTCRIDRPGWLPKPTK